MVEFPAVCGGEGSFSFEALMTDQKKYLKGYYLIAFAITIAIAAFIFKSEKMMSFHHSFPYFSGSANFKTLFDWRISPDEYKKMVHMSNEEQRAYHYVSTQVTVPNTINSYGYVLVALAARNLFPWLGDIQAVVLFQTLVHIGLSLIVLTAFLKSRLQKGIFILLYAVNPLVLQIVTSPFYYFWAVLPSVALAVVWFKKDKILFWIPVLTIVMIISLFIRSTTFILALLVFAVAFWRNRQMISRCIVVASFMIFISSFLWLSQHGGSYGSPYFTAYVGIGAYSNPYGIHGEDSDGYDYYRQKTGETIYFNPIAANDVNNPNVMARFQNLFKHRYFEIIKESPVLLMRNAILNTIQAFGVGTDNHLAWTRPLTVGIGLLVIVLFLVTKQWIWSLGILAYAGGFALFFPPIITYLFGAYILTVLGCCFALEKLLFRFWPEHRFMKMLLKQ